jgi:uncharacterized PurR-regulated membrane protein YhhQ (DUF165 family)
MDPIFASVVLGFFALVIALVAVTIAIAYRQSEIAQEALKSPGNFYKATYPAKENTDENNDVR